MDCSTPGFPLLHHLLELAQTYVHWVGDAIQPSQPLSSPSILPSIFPSIRVFSNESALPIRWPKYLSFSISSSNEYSELISFRIDWFDLSIPNSSRWCTYVFWIKPSATENFAYLSPLSKKENWLSVGNDFFREAAVWWVAAWTLWLDFNYKVEVWMPPRPLKPRDPTAAQRPSCLASLCTSNSWGQAEMSMHMSPWARCLAHKKQLF